MNKTHIKVTVEFIDNGAVTQSRQLYTETEAGDLYDSAFAKAAGDLINCFAVDRCSATAVYDMIREMYSMGHFSNKNDCTERVLYKLAMAWEGWSFGWDFDKAVSVEIDWEKLKDQRTGHDESFVLDRIAEAERLEAKAAADLERLRAHLVRVRAKETIDKIDAEKKQ